MKYYQPMPCDNYHAINQEILAYIDKIDLVNSNQGFWNPLSISDLARATPLFVKWLMASKIPVKSVAATLGFDEQCCGPHTDTPPSIYKLSWPVLNTEYSFNRWFEEAGPCDKQINSLGGTLYLDPSQLIEVDRVCVDRPLMIATGVPHDVWFAGEGKFPRIGLQCQFVKEPSSL